MTGVSADEQRGVKSHLDCAPVTADGVEMLAVSSRRTLAYTSCIYSSGDMTAGGAHSLQTPAATSWMWILMRPRR